jgi:hypothetical protein
MFTRGVKEKSGMDLNRFRGIMKKRDWVIHEFEPEHGCRGKS